MSLQKSEKRQLSWNLAYGSSDANRFPVVLNFCTRFFPQMTAFLGRTHQCLHNLSTAIGWQLASQPGPVHRSSTCSETERYLEIGASSESTAELRTVESFRNDDNVASSMRSVLAICAMQQCMSTKDRRLRTHSVAVSVLLCTYLWTMRFRQSRCSRCRIRQEPRGSPHNAGGGNGSLSRDIQCDSSRQSFHEVSLSAHTRRDYESGGNQREWGRCFCRVMSLKIYCSRG